MVRKSPSGQLKICQVTTSRHTEPYPARLAGSSRRGDCGRSPLRCPNPLPVHNPPAQEQNAPGVIGNITTGEIALYPPPLGNRTAAFSRILLLSMHLNSPDNFLAHVNSELKTCRENHQKAAHCLHQSVIYRPTKCRYKHPAPDR